MKTTQITDGKNLSVELLDYGARITQILVGEKQQNVVVGYSDLERYASDAFYMGATIGPITNRIKNAELAVNGESFKLPANEEATCLHSGGVGFDQETWKLINATENMVEYELVYDLTKVGMRGVLTTIARYIARDNALHIEYESHCDTTTYINLTNHVYLNLSSQRIDISNHDFVLHANKFVIKDAQNNSTGKVEQIGSPFKYSAANDNYLDQHFIVKDDESNTELVPVASVTCNDSGVQLDVSSSSPGFHLYTGHGLSEPFIPAQGFCIETQTIPNAINLTEFDAPLLTANERRIQTTIFKFSE